MFDSWWFRSKYLEGAELYLAGAYLTGLGSAALAIASPFVLNDANEKYYKSNSADLSEAFQVFSIYIACLVGYDTLDIFCQHIILEVSNKIDEKVIHEWSEKVFYMSLTQRKPFESGIDIHRQLSNARNNFYTQIQGFYVQGIIRAAQIVGVFIASFFIVEGNRALSYVFLGYLSLNILAGALYRYLSSNRLASIGNHVYGAQNEQQDINLHHLLVTVYNVQEAEINKLKDLERKILDLQREGQWIEYSYKWVISALGRGAQLFILAFAAQAVLNPATDFDTPDLVTVLLFFQLLLAPMQQLNSSLTSLMSSEPTLKRIKDVINSYTYESITILPNNAAEPTSVDRKTIIIQKNNNHVTAYWSATNGVKSKQLPIANLGKLGRTLFPIQAINSSADVALIRAIVEKFECSYIQIGAQPHAVENPLILPPPIHNPIIEFRNVTFSYPNMYSMGLITSMANQQSPKPRKIYVDIENGRIKYILKSPADTTVKDYITANQFGRAIPNNPIELFSLLDDILAVTLSRNHTEIVLNNTSFVIRPNTVNAIVGQSSVGKSTIFRLLMQLFDQFTGEIFVNGKNINHISAVELQQFIVLIPQITEFFDRRTLRENITVANPDASDQNVDDSLNAIELGGLRQKLDDQHPDNCKLDELSGGAQKRIGAARCLVRQHIPKIYIFDEPTTGLDAKLAFELMQKLKELSAQHTVLLITHYLKFAKSADQILFMYKNASGTQLKADTHNNLTLGQDEGSRKYQDLLLYQNDSRYEGFWQNRQPNSGNGNPAPSPQGSL